MPKKTKKKNKLSPIRVRFSKEFMQSLNATQAYFNVYKCTMAAARRAGSRMLTNVDVQEYIQTQRDKEAKTAGVTQQMLIDEYKKIAFGKVTKASVLSHADQLKALNDLGKHLGLFAEDNKQKAALTLVDIAAQIQVKNG